MSTLQTTVEGIGPYQIFLNMVAAGVAVLALITPVLMETGTHPRPPAPEPPADTPTPS